MRIGISLLHLLPGGIFGSEIYVRNLLSGLASLDTSHEYFLFTNTDNHETFMFANSQFRRILCRIGARPQIRRIAVEQILLPRLASLYRLDVLHSPGYTAPLSTPCASVVSILDMLYRVYPQIIPQPKRLFWQVFVPLSARRSHAILTISENSRRDIVKFLHIPTDKVVVSHLAIDKLLVEHRLGQGIGIAPSREFRETTMFGPYIFTLINSIRGHKNLQGLLTAFKKLQSRLPQIRLVVGGGAGNERETLRVVDDLGLRESTRMLGYLSLEELIWLYGHAEAYVIPSLFEGFGLPALEAMYFGVPVACSNAGSLPEIVGDAGLFFNPKDPADIADCLYRVLSDSTSRADLIQKGRRRVSEFSWQDTARKTLAGYELAVSRKGKKVNL